MITLTQTLIYVHGAVNKLLILLVLAKYGTIHPQLKQHTRVTRMGHACAVHVTRVAFYCCGFTSMQI